MLKTVGLISQMKDDAGVGYVIEEGTKRQHVFCYSKIRGYKGECAKELRKLGLGRGHIVWLWINEETETVAEIAPLVF